ncbi:ribonuclease III [Gammaproteobacteria bacterium]|nr:ribonuclease III [Gammaproteobacteria bacterium]
MNSIDIEKLLSQKLKNSQLYTDSLTHRSASNKNNERLEFFGDAILGFFIAEYLYDKFPEDDEGDLSRKRSHLVRKDTLSKIGAHYGLGKKIILGAGEKKSGGNKRDSIIADALEALIAVVYLVDGPEEARSFIHKVFDSFIKSLPSNDGLKDAKTKLQEILQAQNCELPQYETKEVNIKNKISFVTLCKIVEHNICEDGDGSNKRKSQQVAAEKALNKISKIYKK